MATGLFLEASNALGYIQSHALQFVLSLSAAWLIKLLYTGYQHRKLLHSLPGPPHSWFWGHLKLFGEAMKKLPPDAHPHFVHNYISKTYPELNEAGLFYLDMWPISMTQVIITDGKMAAQVTQVQSFDKHPGCYHHSLGNAAGMKAFILLEGEAWRNTAKLFSRGFSHQNIVDLLPMIIEETGIYLEELGKKVKQVKEEARSGGAPYLRMLDYTTGVTADIIGRAVFGIKLRYQTKGNSFMTSIVDSLPMLRESPTIPVGLEFRKLRRLATREAKHYIKARWNWIKTGKVVDEFKDLEIDMLPTTSKPVLDFAFMEYHNGVKDPQLTDELLSLLIDNVKLFVIAGHDTTSSAIAHVLQLLSKHPKAMEKVIAELDEVLGPADQTANRILSDPTVLNRLPYLTATIRETLRIYTLASTVRAAPPGATILGKDGVHYPTDPEMMIWPFPMMILNKDTYGPTTHDFIPERFLDMSTIPKDAYRPFSKSPRVCIGQELAMIELKVVVAMTVRRFRFKNGYPEFHKREKGDIEWLNRFVPFEQGGVPEAYGTLSTSAKPHGGVPLIVEEIGK
ncbi:cytochrome P450 [Ascobolus immersus RN42]|uniref:Cytochrome P450 n=1 Tax=Ascobolus immersus RN42 TaxID=1160509 RepID=A0A3N4HL60_ASCIM|nr:cytochrome P450 [Ascobolus immersus RN42]